MYILDPCVANNAKCLRSRVVRKSGNVSTAFAFYKKQFLIIPYNDLLSASTFNLSRPWEMEITLNYKSQLSNVDVANKVKITVTAIIEMVKVT